MLLINNTFWFGTTIKNITFVVDFRKLIKRNT